MRARIEERRAARRRRRARIAAGLTVIGLAGVTAFGVTLFMLLADETRPAAPRAPAPAVASSLTTTPIPVFEETVNDAAVTDEPVTGTTGVPEADAEVPAGGDAQRPRNPRNVPTDPSAVMTATQRSATPTMRTGEPTAAPRPAATDVQPVTARAETGSPNPTNLPVPVAESAAAASRLPQGDVVREVPDGPQAQRTAEPSAPPIVEPTVEAGAPALPGSTGNPAVEHTPTPAPAAAVPPPATVVDPRTPVREAIERYRVAYERLDAGAARAVWPTVDQGALSRAFSSLTSQQLTFDGCTFDVAGASARANCRGRTRVVPRVGGGTETARREWSFWLRQSGGQWVIEKAEVR